MTPAINTLNSVRREQALAALAPLVERSPWVAEAAVDQRPFASDEAVAEALVEVILAATPEQRLAMFNVHPELSGSEAAEGRMTAESTSEQGRLGLIGLPQAEAQRLKELNAAYRARFGHPFIIALHRVPDRAALFETFERRLAATQLEEHTSTLAEIASVIRSRCRNAFGAASETTL
ncbi:2-oxo-4-hydroxy-4-carboxy-5-ureidoimidazoline decarboxylase [Mesobacterium pallidum]|uniref:2-oxo-4-hydroxy-4-carboxy-5-ureidoimidazoline decarboxylase n=1 Tax=Mesobacterium pallidum TaxID=2872037 RepID=UPI001EE31C69|nr:2-oxo-4-hydroxy-4-carboxy-5-ureidoimidazoline decarboxylase [Mesobacterium pallidum]